MASYDNLKLVRSLNKRSDTNSRIDLLQEENTDNFFVRKIIYGIDQPLYQAVFSREVRALYKLNSCSNIVKIHSHKHMAVKSTREKVGCIFLEYIFGETLAQTKLLTLSSKEKFRILNQVLSAIEVAHSNGIIHRDINPNNIMITEEKNAKVIDFGICKIKEMVNSATLYQMATNLYSAPEVHLHSENATEQSDLYSIGAVIYYMFTGKEPPIPSEFQGILENTSGIDIELKPIISKLVSENSDDRYQDIYSLKIDLSSLFGRFLNVNQQLNVSMDFEKFKFLKNKHLLPQSAKISDTELISQNFSELYAFKTSEGYFDFLGLNYRMICSYNPDNIFFSVLEFKKVVPIERENYKKKYAEISATVNIVDPRFIHRQSKNGNLEICNIVNDYYKEFISKKNVALEYKSKYGAWRDLLELTKQSIESNIIRFLYDSYSINENVISFVLSKGVFLPESVLTKEQMFIYEKTSRKKQKTTFIIIGYYEDDYFENDHVILKVRFDKHKPNIPNKGVFCLDYRKDIANVQRQLDALDIIEKEDYSCTFSLKEIISGVEAPNAKELTDKVTLFNKQLDMSQQAAVQKALNSESLCIIQGPPGTGKTNVVIEIIRQILHENNRNPDLPEKKILLVSQSHPAVDKMLDDLIEISPNRQSMIRIGRDEKLNQQIREEYGINYVKENWVIDTINKCKEYMANTFAVLGVSKNEFETYYSENEKLQIKDYEKDNIDTNIIDTFIQMTSSTKREKLRKILEIQKQWTEQLPHSDDVDLYIIKSTTIIAGTCTGFISNRVIRDAEFDYLIIDEAAKATFPELAVSFNKAGKIIMVGDHKQLPPVLDNDLINENKDKININNLSEGIFEKLYDSFPDENKHRLTVQYRMHPTIGTLISQVFYDNDIQNGVEREKRQTGIPAYRDTAIEWISTSSKSDKERHETKVGNSPNFTYKNDLELKIIKEKLAELDKSLGRKIKVAVITAYSAQKYALNNMVKQQRYVNLQIEVDTVDAFQGSQKEIIIYSTVRSSNNPFAIGFLKSEARLNVAFSRAQSLLIIVGDHNFLDNKKITDNKFPEIIKYITENDSCRIKDA